MSTLQPIPSPLGATKPESFLHPYVAPAPLTDANLPRLRALPVKEFLVSRSHYVVIILSAMSIIMFVASWGAAAAFENDGRLHRRHAAGIIAFIWQVITTVLVIVVLRVEPRLILLYFLEVMCVLTLALTAISWGTNNVVVDICTVGVKEGFKILCPAHVAEFFASFFVCISMMLVYGATQQRIAMLIDKGILMGIRGRMTQL